MRPPRLQQGKPQAKSLKRVSLDALDRKLLAAVQVDNQRNAEQLGAMVGLSPSACLRRLRKLEATGVIEANVAVVNPATLGRGLTMLVNISLERERHDLIDNFKKVLRKTPEVMQAYYVTGQSDIVLVVTAKDMADYQEFVGRFFFDNANIRHVETQVVMDRIKVGLVVPVEE
jgi:Lrp/AsnC family leucine-responsive transcriptional regulator